MNILTFFIPPIMGGLIALFTNWLAIRMLFRPHTEKRVFGIKVPFTPGLIPKEWDRLAKRLSKAISTRLLTPDLLAKELSDPSLWPLPDMTVGEAMAKLGMETPEAWKEPISTKMKEAADKLLPKAFEAIPTLPETHPWLDEKLAAFTYKVIDENTGGLTGLFISKKKIYKSIKDGLFEYLSQDENQDIVREKIHTAIDTLLEHDFIEETILTFHIRDGLTQLIYKEKHALERVLEIMAKYLSQHIPVQAMIEHKLASFDVAEAEEIILSVAGRELKMIVLLGGVLGFMIGLILPLL